MGNSSDSDLLSHVLNLILFSLLFLEMSRYWLLCRKITEKWKKEVLHSNVNIMVASSDSWGKS